jgi:hypothetical protein
MLNFSDLKVGQFYISCPNQDELDKHRENIFYVFRKVEEIDMPESQRRFCNKVNTMNEQGKLCYHTPDMKVIKLGMPA